MKAPTFLFTAAVASLFAITGGAADKQPDPSASDGKTSTSMQKMEKTDRDSSALILSLTVQELADYNGADGKPAYVAVDGVIYDVSPIKPWKKGKHKGRHTAGAELGHDIKKNSPHGLKVLKKLKVVGKVVPAAE